MQEQIKKEWNPTKDDLLNVERTIADKQDEYDELSQKKKDLEFDLSKINSQIRMGRRLDDNAYDALVRNQNRIKGQISALREPMSVLKKTLRRKHLMKDEIKHHLSKKVKISSEELVDKIVSFRKYYNDFASDATRVSSTRIMASRFAKDLQELLNILKT